MSFEIFLQAQTEGGAAGFDRAIVERAFKPYVADMSGETWNINWPDGSACFADVYIDEGPMIYGLMVSRPPAFPEFWNALYDIMLQSKSMLMWPSEDRPRCCIADPATSAGFPSDFVEAEEPLVVSSGAEIWEMLK